MSLKHETIYFLFARLFREAPTADLLRTIVDLKLLTAARDFFKEGVIDEGEILENSAWIEESEKIALEFASLFLVPGEKMIPPYESFYCDTLKIDTSTACSAYFESERFPEGGIKGFLYGPSTRSVQKSYEVSGFELDLSFHDLPDHVAVELEFMGRLHESGKTNQIHQFFQKHPDRWIKLFLDKIIAQNTSDFYRVVAQNLKEFLGYVASLPTPSTTSIP